MWNHELSHGECLELEDVYVGMPGNDTLKEQMEEATQEMRLQQSPHGDGNKMRVRSFVVMQGESLEEEEESASSESAVKTGRVRNEHRPDFPIRRALDILLNRLDGKIQADKTRLGWIERLRSEC